MVVVCAQRDNSLCVCAILGLWCAKAPAMCGVGHTAAAATWQLCWVVSDCFSVQGCWGLLHPLAQPFGLVCGSRPLLGALSLLRLARLHAAQMTGLFSRCSRCSFICPAWLLGCTCVVPLRRHFLASAPRRRVVACRGCAVLSCSCRSIAQLLVSGELHHDCCFYSVAVCRHHFVLSRRSSG